MINPDTLHDLLRPRGQEALAAATAAEPSEADFLIASQRLGRRFPPPLARAAIEQVILRKRARAKFSMADHMYFTRQGLEQATPEAVALYRASRFGGLSRLFDFGCGIGGDTLALARAGIVTAVDRNWINLLLLAANAKVLNLAERIFLVQADLRSINLKFPTACGVFFDPDRRKGAQRLHSVVDYQPPLHQIEDWLPKVDVLAVKVSPAVKLDQIAKYDCEIEFVSLRGKLKEAVLWFGAAKSAPRRATVLPGPHILSGEEPWLPIQAPQTYIYEPDPAVLRAGLVRCLGSQIGAAQIDPTIALLTSDRLVTTPFADTYRVEEVIPFGLKRLRATLRARDIGKIVLKKRGSAVDAESFVRRLRLRGSNEATVILTLVDGRKKALIVEPLSSREDLSH